MPPCRKRSRRNRDAPILHPDDEDLSLGTPENLLSYEDRSRGLRCEPGPGALLLLLFYDDLDSCCSLLLFEVDTLEFVALDGSADLGRRFAQFGLLVGEEAFFGAGGALRAVQALKAAAQAGMAKSTVAPAVAGELVEDVPDAGGLLVDVHLPGVLEVFAGKARP
jgi:hypothetical protein